MNLLNKKRAFWHLYFNIKLAHYFQYTSIVESGPVDDKPKISIPCSSYLNLMGFYFKNIPISCRTDFE